MIAPRFGGLVVGLAWLLLPLVAWADYRTDVGYEALHAELGVNLPTGAGVAVSQIEAPDPTNYLPDVNNGEFVGKTITDKSNGATGASGHATTVGGFFYGLSGMARGVSLIDAYEVNSWLNAGFLRLGSNSAPVVESRAVSNHSWIGSYGGDGSLDQEVLRRFDFAIQRDDFLAVVALNNGSGSTVPQLLGSSYNGLVVGLSNGGHSSGTSTADGTGRVKPDIVSPYDLTSFGTPIVGAAAALLIQKAASGGSPVSAAKSVTIKAILLAGATKSQFADWDRTTTRPLDEHYGVGQLNIYRSYHVLTAGPQAVNTNARPRGWDFQTTTAGGRLYFFDIAAGNGFADFSAALTWNRIIADGTPGPNWGNPTSTLPNLSLKLHTATGFTVGTLVDSSLSAVDNVEHIYQPTLAPGRYALEVISDTSGVDYGLAWNSLPTVTIAATTPTAAEEGAAPGGFTITRAGETVEALTVNLTISGSALNGTDYTTIPAIVTISAGASSATVTIAPITDALAEGAETVTLTLANHLAYAIGGANSATVTMADRPFDAWRFGEFTTPELSDPQISGAEADPDSDGIQNLEEYAFQLPPKTPSVAGLPVVGRDPSGALTLSYTLLKSASDITCVAEISTDMSMWNSGAGYTSVQTTDQGLTWSVIATSLLSPVTEPLQFMRIRITKP